LSRLKKLLVITPCIAVQVYDIPAAARVSSPGYRTETDTRTKLFERTLK